MKLNYLFIAGFLCAGVACTKSTDTASEPGGYKEVRLTLAGDMTVSNSPLGRLATSSVAAKTFADSTIYAVVIRKDGTPVYYGFYNRADSMTLKIPNSGNIGVEALVIRKGTGPGMYGYNNMPGVVIYPWLGNLINNRMDTVLNRLYYNIDSLYKYNMFNDDGSLNDKPTINSEADSYVGKINFASAQTPAQITLSMRRVVFGIRYNVSNFNSGRLIADFANLMSTRTFDTGYNFSKQFVYTANDLQQADSTFLRPVNLTLKWQKPDGTIAVIGQKTIVFYRNVLTDIHVTIPNQNTGAPAMPIDTNWQRTASINF